MVTTETPTEDQTETAPPSDPNFWSRFVDQRREDRIDFRTTGILYSIDEVENRPVSESTPVRFWTVDVSTGGALLRTFEPVDAKNVLIELILPQLSGSLLAGKVVRQSEEVARYINGKDRTSHLYGIKFSRILTKESLSFQLPKFDPQTIEEDEQEQLTETAEIQPAPTVNRKSVGEFKSDVTSRMPTLSALGLAAVYAALILVF